MRPKKGLSHDEQLELLRRLQAGDTAARWELVTRSEGLVRCILAGYRVRPGAFPSPADLLQVGLLKLYRIAHRWEPDRGSWSTFTAPSIRQAIARYRRKHMSVIDTAYASVKFHAARSEGEATTDRQHRQRDASRRALGALHCASLDAPIPGGDGGDNWIDTLAAEGPSAEDQLADQQVAVEVRAALATLPDRAREILWSRARGEPLGDIGQRIGLSGEGVRQAEVKALPVLKKALRL